jgi:lipopolysaccharide biosynthesis glycosyltransferase
MNESCFVFYNYGNKCFIDLLVALKSLYLKTNSKILVFLNEFDTDILLQREEISNLFPKVEIRTFDLKIFPKNTYSMIKPFIIKSLNYEKIIICDSDLLFLNSVDEIFLYLDFNDLVVTSQGISDCCFNNRLVHRLKSIDSSIDCRNYPYYNIGILGINKKCGFVELWDRECSILNKKISTGAVDETVLNFHAKNYNKLVLGSDYNFTTKELCGNKHGGVKIAHFAFSSLSKHQFKPQYEDVLKGIIPLLGHLEKWIVAKN